MKLLAVKIQELQEKVKYYGFEYGRTRDDSWYRKRYFAKEGLKMAKQEFNKLQREHERSLGL